ncbi:MAG TPA: S8 family peptidase [Acidimicrobiales bacterium]|nr:S8 family peptidase [Acidimicrobiales bacterium]
MAVFTRRGVVLAVVLALSVAAAPAAQSRTGTQVAVIVQARSAEEAAAAVRAVGGTVTQDLWIVDGVGARVPSDAVDELAGRPGVRSVTPDGTVRVAGTTTTLGGEDESTVNHVLAREVDADRLWSAGVTGAGVGVALIDTGVSPVGDLAGRVRPVRRDHLVGTSTRTDRDDAPCVDFSGEGHCGDSFGHGTFLAGLIAGSGAASGGKYAGVAPGAHLVSVKIAGHDGSADVTKVIAAVQWVVSFRQAYGIRVLNLSLGTDSTAPWHTDPLNYAVEQAWFSGITVVVSAGNRGRTDQAARRFAISKPADDPYVVTVGAVDDRETPSIDDDRLPAFSSTGPTAHGIPKPDVVAPGGRVVSLRAPGSWVEANHRPRPGENPVYRRGSGTSMSAAVVSGVAALVLQGRDWHPNRVKFALATTARKVAARDPLAVGSGLVDAAAARAAGDGNGNAAWTQVSSGTGSLEESRGTVEVTEPCSFDDTIAGDSQDGECHTSGDETAYGTLWVPPAHTDPWLGSSWYTSQWAIASATGSSWYTSTWGDGSWEGSSWYGSSWYGNFESTTPYGATLQGSSWYGAWG